MLTSKDCVNGVLGSATELCLDAVRLYLRQPVVVEPGKLSLDVGHNLRKSGKIFPLSNVLLHNIWEHVVEHCSQVDIWHVSAEA